MHFGVVSVLSWKSWGIGLVEGVLALPKVHWFFLSEYGASCCHFEWTFLLVILEAQARLRGCNFLDAPKSRVDCVTLIFVYSSLGPSFVFQYSYPNRPGRLGYQRCLWNRSWCLR